MRFTYGANQSLKVGIILLAFAIGSREAHPQASPNQTASDFFAAVGRRDWPAAARLIDPTDGTALRTSALQNLYGWLETVRTRGDSLLQPDGSFSWGYSGDPPGGWSDSVLTRAYGSRRDLGLPRDLSVTELVSLSPAKFTELLLEVSLAPNGARLNLTLLGVIVEADTIAHGLYRSALPIRFLAQYWNTQVMHLRFASGGWTIVAGPPLMSPGTLGRTAMNAWRLARTRPTPMAPDQPGIRVSTRTFQVTDAKLDAFVPAVPAQDSGGACSTLAPTTVVQRERWLTYIFGAETKPTRRVLVGLDSSGNLVRYSDARGSAVQGPEPDSLAGPGTSISFTTYDPGIFAFNYNAPVMAGRYRLFGANALTAKNLGEIGKLVERVKHECDPPRKG